MKINFGSFKSLSTVDDYGYSTIALFFRGCVLDCKFCHNKHLLASDNFMEIEVVEKEIKRSSLAVSSVTFTGGEPCIQLKPLTQLIEYSKNLNLQTCLYTSGNHHYAIKCVAPMIDRCYVDIKLCDYIGIDCYDYYDRVCSSLNYLRSNNVHTIITCTVFDKRNLSDIRDMVQNEPFVVIQGQRPEGSLSPEQMKKYYHKCFIRTKENGVEWND